VHHARNQLETQRPVPWQRDLTSPRESDARSSAEPGSGGNSRSWLGKLLPERPRSKIRSRRGIAIHDERRNNGS
jgi:hypothetical protein